MKDDTDSKPGELKFFTTKDGRKSSAPAKVEVINYRAIVYGLVLFALLVGLAFFWRLATSRNTGNIPPSKGTTKTPSRLRTSENDRDPVITIHCDNRKTRPSGIIDMNLRPRSERRARSSTGNRMLVGWRSDRSSDLVLSSWPTASLLLCSPATER